MRINHIEKLYEDKKPFYNEERVKEAMYTAYRYAIYDVIVYGASFMIGVLLGIYILKNF